jgi:transposase-like protein
MDESKKLGTREDRGGRRRWPRTEREQLLRDFRASGLTQVRFAAEHGVSIGTLRNWIYKPASADDQSGGFAPVQIVGARPIGSRNAITVRWPQGVEVELAVDLDGSGVVRLVRELLAPCLR